MTRVVMYPQTDDPELAELIDQLKELDAQRDAVQVQINERAQQLRRQRLENSAEYQKERERWQAIYEGRDPITLAQEAARAEATEARQQRQQREARRKTEEARLSGW